ncbi:MAG: hypothetical protein ACTSQP_03525 [Promethearchaeota archaeon]
MKFREAKVFYRILGIFCLIAGILFIIRALINVELDFFGLFSNYFWAFLAIFIFLKFLNRDSFTSSIPEGLFYIFVLYCSFYIPINLILNILIWNPEIISSLSFIIDIFIAIFGWLLIILYIIL